ncbi:MAG: mevalonate kinase [Anaerolineae bacterium]|nr:mevalonate kinase [Anaerolineales bacterium]MCQ3973896.1 mevalonate kinase [Anaerolineae bacterium]
MIEATAPGKIILFGEHAVVYGRPAIAVPVADLQAKATLSPADPGTGFRIIAPDLGRDYSLAQAGPDDPLAVIVQATLRRLGQADLPEATLHISSTIPLGRGLGSGAAISTAITRAIAQFFNQPLAPTEISALVFEVEKLYHGTPSGIDNTVVAFAQPVYFIKGRPIQRMRVSQPLTLVVGDTGVVAPTHTVVGDLRRRWQAEPERYEGYFDEVGAIVNQARAAIEQGNLGQMAIGELMNENQELLETLGVSSPALDRLIEAAREAGALGAKLSGAGWGGNMIALAWPDQAAAIAQALTEAGAVQVITTQTAKNQ